MIDTKVKEAWQDAQGMRRMFPDTRAVRLADAYFEAEWRRRKAEWWSGFFSAYTSAIWMKTSRDMRSLSDDDWRASVEKELSDG